VTPANPFNRTYPTTERRHAGSGPAWASPDALSRSTALTPTPPAAARAGHPSEHPALTDPARPGPAGGPQIEAAYIADPDGSGTARSVPSLARSGASAGKAAAPTAPSSLARAPSGSAGSRSLSDSGRAPPAGRPGAAAAAHREEEERSDGSYEVMEAPLEC
jgi:hypothetical protein